MEAIPKMTSVITSKELSDIIVLLRTTRKWSQEQLADNAKLSYRTVQRVEAGDASSVHTRRCLASAFEAPDIDCFNKPYTRKTMEDLEEEAKSFQRDFIALQANQSTGKTLAKLAERSNGCVIHQTEELPSEAEFTFSHLCDYWRDYSDCFDLYSDTDKVEVHRELQALLDELVKFKWGVVYAERKLSKGSSPIEIDVAYLVAAPLTKIPEILHVPKIVDVPFAGSCL